jgi:hypothetical protein
MAPPKPKIPPKPTVFLSHSSSNRRELLALKRLLDSRAGGLIDFFLSSDEDSIVHGTIWPAEVRDALDRMSLMLVFASSESLKSSWTYFEAGYGLHKLRSVKIYCLPGSDKGKLPSPFDQLQNRNLHSAQEMSSLIHQINETLGSKLGEEVKTHDFDAVFRKPTFGQVETRLPLERLVAAVTISLVGPSDSLEIFSRVCRMKGLTASVDSTSRSPREGRFSTGVRLSVKMPEIIAFATEFKVTEEMRVAGHAAVEIWKTGMWTTPFSWSVPEVRTISEIDEYNQKVREKNAEIARENAKREAAPRDCQFSLAPMGIDVPIGIVDSWLQEAGVQEATGITMTFVERAACEKRVELIAAKIHGSPLSLNEDGDLAWADCVEMEFFGRPPVRLALSV